MSLTIPSESGGSSRRRRVPIFALLLLVALLASRAACGVDAHKKHKKKKHANKKKQTKGGAKSPSPSGTGGVNSSKGVTTGKSCGSLTCAANEFLSDTCVCTLCFPIYGATCASCNATACTSRCTNGFFNISNGACILCSEVTSTCNPASEFLDTITCGCPGCCTQCSARYGSTCTSCDADRCTNTCPFGQARDTVTGACKSCANFAFGSKSCTVCDSTKCLGCLSGSIVGPSGSCIPCGFQCTKCTSDGSTCLACGPGYYISGGTCLSCSLNGLGNACTACTSSTCTACTSSCATCSSTGCNACNAGFVFSAQDCVSCKLMANAGPNCLACSTSACTQCAPGYNLVNGMCSIVCSANCSVCTTPNTCSTCLPGFFLNPSLTQVGTGSCEACPTKCATCKSATICQTCVSGAKLAGGVCS